MKIGDGLDESPTVMVGEKQQQLCKNRGILKPSQAFVKPKSYLKCNFFETPVESGKELKKYIKDKHPDKSKQVLLDWGWLF